MMKLPGAACSHQIVSKTDCKLQRQLYNSATPFEHSTAEFHSDFTHKFHTFRTTNILHLCYKDPEKNSFVATAFAKKKTQKTLIYTIIVTQQKEADR